MSNVEMATDVCLCNKYAVPDLFGYLPDTEYIIQYGVSCPTSLKSAYISMRKKYIYII